MLILAFESSAKTAAVALDRDGVTLGEYFQNSGQTHSRTLLRMAEDLMGNCDVSARDLDAVAVASGPGSFTGLRIGVAAAKGLAWGRQIPCVGVSTLEAMARGVAIRDGVIAAVMDARRDQVYAALFRMEDGVFTRLTDDGAVALSDFEKDLNSVEKPKILVGDGASLCYNTLDQRSDLILLPEHLRYQRASGVILAARAALERGDLPPASDLIPNYLRLSQAERERAEKLREK